MVVIAEFNAQFQWGLLLISDSESKQPIPEWASELVPVTSNPTTIAARVMPDVEGTVRVRLADSAEGATGEIVFSGQLAAPTRRVNVSDVLGTVGIVLELASDSASLAIMMDDVTEASEVTIVIRNGVCSITSLSEGSSRD